MTTRVLVTGFSIFPGTPYNPSETLVRLLEERRPHFGPDVFLETALFETSYKTIADRLAEIGQRCPPNIALHFGLARTANGFRLERSARNLVSSPLADITGHTPAPGAICEGPDSHGSSLPLERIYDALTARGIPTEFSDDTGGYVCNFTYYHSRGGLVAGFQPELSGFIHIPYLEEQIHHVADSDKPPRISEAVLWTGALTIIKTCVSIFADSRIDGKSRQAVDRFEQRVIP